MSWFGRYQASNSTNQVAQQAQQLLVPDSSSSDDENSNHDAAEAVGEQAGAAGAPLAVNMPTTNYDAHHADDEADNAMDKAINALKNKEWGEDDLPFYFQQIEIQMKKAGVKSNFTKLQVLSTVLPKRVSDEIKSILRKQESEFTRKDAYLQAKAEIIKTFGPSEGANCERAPGCSQESQVNCARH